jgi:RimJ/RimL family protein N-acetyltransferase
MTVVRTERLELRRLTVADAAFVLELVNDPDWLRHIGDRGVRTTAEAEDYLRRGPLAMYEKFGFGLWAVVPASGGEPLGICGLIKRDSLPDVDVGYAFLPRYRGQGYAREAVAASLAHGRDVFGLRRIVAITSPDNERSVRLLTGLGLREEARVRLSADGGESRLFAWNGEGGGAAGAG